VGIVIPIFWPKVEYVTISSMEDEAKIMLIFILFILGAGVGFYVARFLF